MARRLFFIVSLVAVAAGVILAPERSGFEVARWEPTVAERMAQLSRPVRAELPKLTTEIRRATRRSTGEANASAKVTASATATAPTNSISILGRTISVTDVNSTAVNAGDHVNKYGAKFLYGHNTATVFGGLVSLRVGDMFHVTTGGVGRDFRVAETVIYEKVSRNQLGLNGTVYNMRAIVNGQGRYDMVLMTCYGTMFGNGDASHRLVIYANAV